MPRHTTLALKTLPVEERRQRIESEPLPRNIHDLIATAAREVGDRPLWDFFESGEQATYGQMYERVLKLAAGLQSAGVRKGSHVAVMLPNVEAFPLTWLAIGVLGAVMVPVNVGYQQRELVYVVNDSDAEYLVVDAGRIDTVSAALAAREIRLKPENIILAGPVPAGGFRAWADLANCQDPFTPPPVDLDDLLNIQYTSGTTGFPKGCMLAQRYWIVCGKINAFRDARVYRRILASTPFYYMDPQWLLLMTIYQRATLFVAARQSTSRFTSWLNRFQIEFCLFPYIVFKQPPSPEDPVRSVLRGNVYGIPRSMHAALEERFDFCAREAFGMTEVGSAMFMPIEAADMVGSGSCGQPSPFRECRIVDPEGREVPRGEIGELTIRGAGILQGYYKREEATAQALRDGWFHTGDLFRQDERGYFYIVGRAKDMVRRSSENIAAREVEAVVNSAPAVLESAVIGVPDELRGEEVKAFVVLKDDIAPNQAILDEIIATCVTQLASFKVPRYFSFRTQLPKTPSLKVAKQTLKTDAAHAAEPTFDRVHQRWTGVTTTEADIP